MHPFLKTATFPSLVLSVTRLQAGGRRQAGGDYIVATHDLLESANQRLNKEIYVYQILSIERYMQHQLCCEAIRISRPHTIPQENADCHGESG